MRTITVFVAFLTLFLAPVLHAVIADTTESQSEPPRRRFRSERAMIHWHEGVQQMVISAGLPRQPNTPWIFPIKGDAEQIQYHLTDSLPQSLGPDCRRIAEKRLDNINCAVAATQVWTLPIAYFRMDRSGYSGRAAMPTTTDVEGVHLELLSADSAAQLAEQLQGFGLVVEAADLDAYADFFAPAYALLVAWRDAPEESVPQTDADDAETPRRDAGRSYRRRPTVFVEFPSEAPYYPMSHRGEEPGRLSLTLTGVWQVAEQDQAAAIQCQQHKVQADTIPAAFKATFPKKNIPLTTVSFSANPSEPIQTDLTFTAGQTSELQLAGAIAGLSYPMLAVLGIIVLSVVSYVAAGISGLAAFGKWRGFSTFGLWNILSIVAIGLAMKFGKTKIHQTLRKNNWKTRLFLVMFSVLVVALSFAVFAAIKLPLKPY